jgi:hypothetical protein
VDWRWCPRLSRRARSSCGSRRQGQEGPRRCQEEEARGACEDANKREAHARSSGAKSKLQHVAAEKAKLKAKKGVLQRVFKNKEKRQLIYQQSIASIKAAEEQARQVFIRA